MSISIEIKLLLENLSDVYNYSKKLTVTKLVKILKELSDYYYNTQESLVTDEVYDLLRDVLVSKNKDHPFLKQVGAPIKKDKVQLPYNLPSLDKIKPNTNVLSKFISQHPGPYVLSDKLDGASALLLVKNNKMTLYSRGDGIKGKDISPLIQYVIPKDIKLTGVEEIAVRGELIISKVNFKKISDKFSNARNAVNSHMTNSQVNKDLALVTEFVAYSVVYPRYKQDEQMKSLKKYNFNVVTNKISKVLTNDLLSDYLVDRRKNSEYEVDGIVVSDSSKVYDIPTVDLPTHTFAFKTVLTDQIAETTVLDVLWTISKHAYLKPRIRIQPVHLVGVEVEYATAYNAKFIHDNKLGPGALIKIIRSGDVIPKIISVIKPAKEAKMPSIPYKWNDTGVDIVPLDIHTNSLELTVKKITNFFRELGVMHLSEGIITKLVEHKYDSIVKILKVKRSNLYEIEGLGKKSIDKIFANIDEAFKTTDIIKLMAGSTLFGRGLGIRKIKLIIYKYPDLMLLDMRKDELIKKIVEINGFDVKLATQFASNFEDFKEWFDNINKVYDIEHLRVYKKKDLPDSKPVNPELVGKKIVFTGFRNKSMEDYIVSIGSSLSTGVSSKTDLLVYTDTTSAKYKKAIQLGIKTMTLDEFKAKYF